jgi:uncharacterized protein YbjT (DUF2867 family)
MAFSCRKRNPVAQVFPEKQKMKIAIAGATGLTGSECLKILLQIPVVEKVYAIGRRPTGIAHPKLEEVILVNNQLTIQLQADAFVCCLGTTMKKAGSREAFEAVDLHLPLHLAKVLHDNGCSNAAIVSAMGANNKSAIYYNRIKGLMEEGMKQTGFESLHLLRPSIIEGERLEKRSGEKLGLVVIKFLEPIMLGSWKNYRSIKASQIANGLAACILNNAKGQFTYLSESIKQLYIP